MQKDPKGIFFLKKIDQCHDHNIFQVEEKSSINIDFDSLLPLKH